MELHHQIALAFGTGAAVLPFLGQRSGGARRGLWHGASVGCCGLGVLTYMVYAWLLARRADWFSLMWLSHDLRLALPLLLGAALLANGFCAIPQSWRAAFFRILGKVWVWLVIVVVFAGFILSFSTWEDRLLFEGAAYEYHLGQEEPVGQRQVVLDVSRSRAPGALRYTGYRGTLRVEGWGEQPVWVSVPPEDRHFLYLRNEGENEYAPVQANTIYFSPDHKQFVIAYAVWDFEHTEDGVTGRSSFDPAAGTILCVGAADYDEMLALCGQLGMYAIPQAAS